MNSFVGYNIIGDIHGMDAWKSLVKDDCINVFVGDFFDPYTPYSSHTKNVLLISKRLSNIRKNTKKQLFYGGIMNYITCF